MIDRARLLADLKPVLIALEDDIRERVAAVDDLSARLAHEHEQAVDAQRTAMSLEEWSEGEITQAAVAWVLGCVFIRFLEDNLLIDQALLSGPGDRRSAALGHREEHFRRHPEQSDREYLEAVFRDVAHHPAVTALYDERHNPLWRLGPTADGAKDLRELWTRIDPVTGALVHDFTDPELDTRFLGDLYQDLSEAAKKRYALLQTPIFVEEFILNRTLDPAIAEFGLEQVRMIDPTCGSGHFLIGGFRRLFGLWQEREPGTNAAVLVQRALDAVYGVDINPYAVAIARFRLVIEALKASGVGRIVESPAFKLNLATGDSLLHGAPPGRLFGGAAVHREGIRHVFDTEDLAELERIFGQGYHAVVGNPPYIAVKDSALRDAYRERYDSCHGKYVLTVPFMERFFDLAEVDAPNGSGMLAGFVGKITGNNFMKREFGAPLVEKFMTSVDLQTVIDASGAYIPGHGTPTVLLFGRMRPPVSSNLRVLDGVRGEPSQPADPAHGLVWSAIERLVDSPGEQDKFVRAHDIERAALLTHPMTLGVGRELRKRLEDSRGPAVGVVAAAVGIASVNGEDDLYTAPTAVDLERLGVRRQQALVAGDLVRDWAAAHIAAIWTFDDDFDAVAPSRGSGDERILWRGKPIIRHRKRFGMPMVARGLTWFEWQELYEDKLRSPLTITWGEVTTHNHFVLDRGGKVFKQTAPVIKLPEGATEEEHLALLGVLNSSVACFWLKQVCQNKGSTVDNRGARQRTAPFEDFYQLNATKLRGFPLPAQRNAMFPAAIDNSASERAGLLDDLATFDHGGITLGDYFEQREKRHVQLTTKMISFQEELDWQVLAAYDLVPSDLFLGLDAPPIELGQRAFEIVLARQVEAGETETTWFDRHGSKPITEVPTEWPAAYRDAVLRRIELIESDPDVGLIERPEHKRRWVRKPWEERQREALTRLVLDALEEPEVWRDGRLRSTAELTDELRRDSRLVETLELLAIGRDEDVGTTVARLVVAASVPQLAAQRLTEKGLAKRAVWERVWDLQRAEDRIDVRAELPEDDPSHLSVAGAERMKGDEVGRIPVPPRYGKGDFLPGATWKYRGKLDVPKERFVLFPTAGRGADPSPVVAWAGWDERDLARAIAGRVLELRDQDVGDGEQVIPLLAGVLELLPWIHQWHPDADADYGGTPGEFFELWLDGQIAELSLTRDALRGWRSPTPARGRRKVPA
jgi:hypothetical protein